MQYFTVSCALKTIIRLFFCTITLGCCNLVTLCIFVCALSKNCSNTSAGLQFLLAATDIMIQKLGTTSMVPFRVSAFSYVGSVSSEPAKTMHAVDSIQLQAKVKSVKWHQSLYGIVQVRLTPFFEFHACHFFCLRVLHCI